MPQGKSCWDGCCSLSKGKVLGWKTLVAVRTITLVGTLWLFNTAMKHGPFIDDFPIETSIYKGFTMAMLNNQLVNCMDCLVVFWTANPPK